jgi:hypothetical protein
MVSEICSTYRYTNEEHMTTTKKQLPWVNLARTFGAGIIALLSAPGAHSQPTWTQVFQSGQFADYYAYTDSGTPIEQSGTSTTRPPHTYGADYTTATTFNAGVCPYDNRSEAPSVYWYDGTRALGNPSGTGTSVPPTYPLAAAAEFTETTWGSPITRVKGTQADVDFSSGSGSGVFQFHWGSLENCSYYNQQQQLETYCYQNANGTDPETRTAEPST